jgi:hypothetical protein
MNSSESDELPKVVSADVPTSLARQIEAEREEGESRSATVRRLIRAGLEAESGPTVPRPIALGAIGVTTGLLLLIVLLTVPDTWRDLGDWTLLVSAGLILLGPIAWGYWFIQSYLR